MAIIFYKILLGIHPFAATNQAKYATITNLGDKIKEGRYKQPPHFIDQHYQKEWELLEQNHYETLEQIDASSNRQKVQAKIEEEQRFINKRQRIINDIKLEKDAALNHRDIGIKLAESTVNNYCDTLKSITENLENKVFAINSNYATKYQALLDEIDRDRELKQQNINNVEQQFWLGFNVLKMSNLEELLGVKFC